MLNTKNLNLIKEKDFLNCLLIFKRGGDIGTSINNKLKYQLKTDKNRQIRYKSFNYENLKSFLLEFNTFNNFLPLITKFYLSYDEDKLIEVLKSVKYYSNFDMELDYDELENIFKYLIKK